MDKSGRLFSATIGILAVMALIFMVVGVSASYGTTTTQVVKTTTTSDMMRAGGEAHCNADDNGKCSGSCVEGTTCKEVNSDCSCA